MERLQLLLLQLSATLAQAFHARWKRVSFLVKQVYCPAANAEKSSLPVHEQHLVAACYCQTDKLWMGCDLAPGRNIQVLQCQSHQAHFRREQPERALQQCSMVYYVQW